MRLAMLAALAWLAACAAPDGTLEVTAGGFPSWISPPDPVWDDAGRDAHDADADSPSAAAGDASAPPPVTGPAPDKWTSSLTAISLTALCDEYRGPMTDDARRMLLEAELVSRGVESCDGAALGTRTAVWVGVPRYARSGRDSPASGADYDCNDFTSPASAQRYFLEAGGPAVDRHGIDRDGDGLACEWGREIRRVATARRSSPPMSQVARSVGSARCYVGPRGGTYTITASGRKNYGGC
jgi:hypothetical protein